MKNMKPSEGRGDSPKHGPRARSRTSSFSRAARANSSGSLPSASSSSDKATSNFSLFFSGSCPHHDVLGSTSLATGGPSTAAPATDEACRTRLGALCAWGARGGAQSTGAAANSAPTLRNANKGRNDTPRPRDKAETAFKLMLRRRGVQVPTVLAQSSRSPWCGSVPTLSSAELHRVEVRQGSTRCPERAVHRLCYLNCGNMSVVCFLPYHCYTALASQLAHEWALFDVRE